MELTDFKVLTFDCYGTLIDWESGIWEALQPMIAAGNGGCIISMSSGGATRAHRGNVAYDASKGGIEAFTRAAALDLAPYGIRVNAVAPGSILTSPATPQEQQERGEDQQRVELGGRGEPQEDIGIKCMSRATPLRIPSHGDTMAHRRPTAR